MSNATNLDKGVVEGVEFRVLELVVIEAEEVVHDDVAGQRGKGV